MQKMKGWGAYTNVRITNDRMKGLAGGVKVVSRADPAVYSVD